MFLGGELGRVFRARRLEEMGGWGNDDDITEFSKLI